MNRYKKSEHITFQIIVGQLTVPSCLPKEDVRVTICIDNMSKITCSGKISSKHRKITWNHPFLFSAPLTASVKIAIWILPRELYLEWDKQPLGDQIITNVSSLLEFGSTWEGNVFGLSVSLAKISIISRKTNMLTIANGHNCLSALDEFAQKLFDFLWSKNTACILTQIEVELARLDLCPPSHANHTNILNDLGFIYSFCYKQESNIADLKKSIEFYERRLALCPSEHPNHVDAIGDLAMILHNYYDIQTNEEELNRLINIHQEWFNACPLGHSKHTIALGSFATSLQKCYDAQGNVKHLDVAIAMKEKELELCPIGHPDHDTVLNNLAVSINAHYQQLGNLKELNRAIDLQEKCLKLRPPGHQHRGITLQNLALSLWDHYNETYDYSNLCRANKLFKEALQTYSTHHSNFAFNASQIAVTALLLSKNTKKYHNSEPLPSVDEAFEAYRLLKKCGLAASSRLLKAMQAWVKDAEIYNHWSVLDGYQTSLKMLEHISSSLELKYEMIQARVADTANDAFSCAIRHGNFQMAVELLEQGLGILYNQFDISMVVLESWGDQEHELRWKFTRLNADLVKHAQIYTSQERDLYWRVQEEWYQVVDKIRNLEGFSQFLLPPHFDDFQQAAEYGPVIIVNASQYSCDALIVLHTLSPIHVLLCCSVNDVIHLSSQILNLTCHLHAYGPHRELYVKEVLRELWSYIVEPIVAVLQNDVQLPQGSRIWWCPTTKFMYLPFHAAGPHQKEKENLINIYVSSYTPSLSALLRARDRMCYRRKARDVFGATDMISLAAVCQAHPSADTNLGQLPGVQHEILKIQNETNMPANVKFKILTGPLASVEGALQAVRDNRWVHIACHGGHNAEKLFDSWFAMSDGKLTLMRIIQERYTNSEFAFLSACHTAKGGLDEVLHLAAEMQFAGFEGVIGTLWKVDDAIAPQVVTRFYREIFKHPNIDFKHAASALNTAVMEAADEVSLETRIAFVHIGI